MQTESHPQHFRQEALLICRHALQVWRMLERRFKWALFFASILMAAISLCSTAFPILLGRLVDTLKHGLDDALPSNELFRSFLTFLLLAGLVFIVREILQVFRSLFVEDTCTRIDKAM